jgi:Mrp family chromosome partitioning ATPase
MQLARRLRFDVLSPDKHLPQPAFRSSNRILALVLRGLFSTDGSVYEAKVEFASSSPRLARDVQRALLRFGIHSILHERSPYYTYQGERRAGKTAYRVLILGQDVLTFAAHIHFWGRKTGRLQSVVGKITGRRRNPNLDTLPLEVWKEVESECKRAGLSWAQLSRGYGYAQVPSTYGGHTYVKQGYLDRRVCPSRNTLRKLSSLLGSSRLNAIAESNIYWDKVVAIEDGGTDEVFDIEVDGSHNFIAEGVLVHNSTVAVNLAVTFAKGARVGIVDADVTGPDVPKILGVEHAQIVPSEAGLEPVSAVLDVKAVSMQLVLGDRDTPVIWRGPLKIKALKQMLMDVNWGELDYLIIDLPPGTSDEPLSIAQEIPDADGAVVVTTPQEVSLLDVRKSIMFARAVNLPVIGIVENMSGMVCPHCGKEVEVFKKGGGEAAARELGLPFLGRIPLDPRIVVGGDAGKPFVLEHPDSEAAKAFAGIVTAIKEHLQTPRPATRQTQR